MTLKMRTQRSWNSGKNAMEENSIKELITILITLTLLRRACFAATLHMPINVKCKNKESRYVEKVLVLFKRIDYNPFNNSSKINKVELFPFVNRTL